MFFILFMNPGKNAYGKAQGGDYGNTGNWLRIFFSEDPDSQCTIHKVEKDKKNPEKDAKGNWNN